MFATEYCHAICTRLRQKSKKHKNSAVANKVQVVAIDETTAQGDRGEKADDVRECWRKAWQPVVKDVGVVANILNPAHRALLLPSIQIDDKHG